ncbi:OprD family outer membrane porin [Pseudomonas sp. PD9R]|uniref:OprD family outer membrane porin n=1 Tax=Pseudomonas sp. PD9R TaxID=2853534 RepID=UPI001C497B8C|nr:OprD family outer membrane porin [Pseudomonas sp. PD9R]MBV6821427.1 OprD family porin [Pseudomonas sp. PD9R]
MKNRPWLGLFALSMSASSLQAQADEAPEGFIEGSSAKLIARNMYFNRNSLSDYPDARGWGQGFLMDYQSGFTQGDIGFGVDSSVYTAYKLDGGRGTVGTGMFPAEGDGERTESSTLNASVKMKWSNTVIKYGDLRPYNPVFATPDLRLMPMTTRGIQLLSDDIDKVSIDIGHFYSSRGYTTTNHDEGFEAGYAGVDAGDVDYAGFTWLPVEEGGVGFYVSRAEDLWRQFYVNANYSLPLATEQTLSFDFNLYRSLDEGQANAGPINVTAWSLATAYGHGPHTFTLSYQKVHGSQPFDYLMSSDGTYMDSIYLANSSQYGDFNGPGEQSIGLGYAYDFGSTGYLHTTLALRYVYGFDIDNEKVDPDGLYAYFALSDKQIERDIDLKTIVVSGALKNLSVRVRYAAHAFTGDSVKQLRIITEYPLDLF